MKNKILFFGLLLVGLYLLWLLAYELWFSQTAIDSWLIELTGRASATLLSWFWSESFYHVGYHAIYLQGKACVSVGAPCNGLELFVVFALFIACMPFGHVHKLWYIPAGILCIFVLNVLRVAALSVNAYYFPSSVDFNHHYLFTFVVYSFVFLLWYYWIRLYAKISDANEA
jgi:exosortase/archaeosortase family protein